MEITKLREILQKNGVVGAGGAGFPTYGKLSDRVDTVLMNCAECEPLLKLHRQLLQAHTHEILQAFALIAETLGAQQAIIGIKKEYKSAIDAVQGALDAYPGMRVHALESVYPAGDEVVLIYEATGRVVRPGGLPVECGVAVFNVETLYNVYRAVWQSHPVTDKCVTVAGEVAAPITLRVPLGASVEDVVAMAGGVTTPDPVYLLGGPMMGTFGSAGQPVTKTTNAILVLPADHPLVYKKQPNLAQALGRAASACCQCQTCTDLCPRHALGHPIQPHLFMRAAANRDFQAAAPFLNTFFCSACGLCEAFSCPQGLSPRSLIAEYKAGLRRAGVKVPAASAGPVSPARDYRKAPTERLLCRLGLRGYEKEAPLDETPRPVGRVRVPLAQHIGAPAHACVAVGVQVRCGEVIGQAGEGLSVNIHAPIDGRVTEVNEKTIRIAHI